MANLLTTLKTRTTESYKTVAPEIRDFVFDYISTVNNNNKFPLLLMPPPVSKGIGTDNDYEELAMEVWVFIPEHDRKGVHFTAIIDECKTYLRAVVLKLLDYRPEYVLMGEINWTHGHFMHNNMLAGSKATFKMKAYYGC